MCTFDSARNVKNTAAVSDLPVNIQIAECISNEYCHPVGKYEGYVYVKLILG